MESETITISLKKYNRLVEDSNILNRLYGAGVDNWEGYEFAMEGYYDDEDDDES